jgi:hypothetical protein
MGKKLEGTAMGRERFNLEEVIGKLREAELVLGR